MHRYRRGLKSATNEPDLLDVSIYTRLALHIKEMWRYRVLSRERARNDVTRVDRLSLPRSPSIFMGARNALPAAVLVDYGLRGTLCPRFPFGRSNNRS